MSVVPSAGSTGDFTKDAATIVLPAIVPAAPVLPVDPLEPWGPDGPVAPVAPLSPAGPAGPCGPTRPWTPCGPWSPWAPWGPAGPTGPGEAADDRTRAVTPSTMPPAPRASAAATRAPVAPLPQPPPARRSPSCSRTVTAFGGTTIRPVGCSPARRCACSRAASINPCLRLPCPVLSLRRSLRTACRTRRTVSLQDRTGDLGSVWPTVTIT